MTNKILLCFAGLLLFFSACQHDEIFEEEVMEEVMPEPENISMLFVSHCRMNDNFEYNPDLLNADLEKYDMLLLGGDLAYETSRDFAEMVAMDELFDFGNEKTLWALGNHDEADLDLVEFFTKRPAFYTFHYGGVTFLVLDTQVDYSKYVGDQLAMIRDVTDTIEHSGALVLLQHKLTWLYNNPVMADEVEANGAFGSCYYCTNPNNFYEDVYPLLIDVESRGVEVFCLAGDLGYHAKSFHHLSPEGIDFLASGMNLAEPDNVAMLFDYDPVEKILSWKDVLVSEL